MLPTQKQNYHALKHSHCLLQGLAVQVAFIVNSAILQDQKTQACTVKNVISQAFQDKIWILCPWSYVGLCVQERLTNCCSPSRRNNSAVSFTFPYSQPRRASAIPCNWDDCSGVAAELDPRLHATYFEIKLPADLPPHTRHYRQVSPHQDWSCQATEDTWCRLKLFFDSRKDLI